MGICVKDDLARLYVASDLDSPAECFPGCPVDYMTTALFRPSLGGGVSGVDYDSNQISNGWLRMCSRISASPGGVSCCDNVQNQAERRVDCGGPCPSCATVGQMSIEKPSQAGKPGISVSGETFCRTI